jgi:hypothetical protein
MYSSVLTYVGLFLLAGLFICVSFSSVSLHTMSTISSLFFELRAEFSVEKLCAVVRTTKPRIGIESLALISILLFVILL